MVPYVLILSILEAWTHVELPAKAEAGPLPTEPRTRGDREGDANFDLMGVSTHGDLMWINPIEAAVGVHVYTRGLKNGHFRLHEPKFDTCPN